MKNPGILALSVLAWIVPAAAQETPRDWRDVRVAVAVNYTGFVEAKEEQTDLVHAFGEWNDNDAGSNAANQAELACDRTAREKGLTGGCTVQGVSPLGGCATIVIDGGYVPEGGSTWRVKYFTSAESLSVSRSESGAWKRCREWAEGSEGRECSLVGRECARTAYILP